MTANPTCSATSPSGMSHATTLFFADASSDRRYASQQRRMTSDSTTTSTAGYWYKVRPNSGPFGQIALTAVMKSAGQCERYVSPTIAASAVERVTSQYAHATRHAPIPTETSECEIEEFREMPSSASVH